MSEHATATHAAPSAHAAHDSGHETSLGVDSRKMGVCGLYRLGNAVLRGPDRHLPDLQAAQSGGGGQDPKEFLGIGVTSVLAAILLASSLTMVLALAAIRRHDTRQFRIWLLSTAGLGLCFLGGQAYEFTKLISEGVTFSSSMFGTTFFVLTGFHGTHVAIGVTWLLSVFTKIWRYPDAPGNDMDVELGGLYWHFVTWFGWRFSR